MLKLFLWLRYLRKRKIVLLSIAAVTLSSALLIAVASLFNGFIRALERSAVEAVGDVVLAPAVKISRYAELIDRLEQSSVVEAATAKLTVQGLLHIGAGNVRAVQVWGIEPQRRAKVTGFGRSLLMGRDSPDWPAVLESDGSSPRDEPSGDGTDAVKGFVGIGVVASPDEQTDEYDFDAVKRMVGKQVVLTTGRQVPGQDARQRRFKRKLLKFTIADIVFTGVYQFDRQCIYLPLDALEKLMYGQSAEPLADQIQIKLCGGCDTETALAQIRGVWDVFASERLEWSPYLIRETTIETAQQMQSRYVGELRKQMGVLLFIFAVVSFSAILLVFCIFYMIVETRRKDIAIMKSCGAASGSVALIYLGFGAFIGVIGSALGVLAGYAVTANINTLEGWIRIVFGLKLWKSSVYMFSRIPNEVDWGSVFWIVVSAIAAAAAGALIPAIVAAGTRPVNVLRYE